MNRLRNWLHQTFSNRKPLDELPTDRIDQPMDIFMTDQECSEQMIESFIASRPEQDKRKHARLPTREALRGSVHLGYPHGILVSARKDAELPLHEEARQGGSSVRNQIFEKVSEFYVTEFSEGGLQIEFRCDNPFEIAQRQLCLQIPEARIPVTFRWYSQSNELLAGGFEFVDSVESSKGLADFLVHLSGELIDHITKCCLSNGASDLRQAGVFAYFSILYHLRLRHLAAVASSNGRDLLRAPEALRPGPAAQTAGGKSFETLFEMLMKPFRDFGCSIQGKGGRVTLLKEDVRNILLSSMILGNGSIDHCEELSGELRPLYDAFTALRARLPDLFQREEFAGQLLYYRDMLRSIDPSGAEHAQQSSSLQSE